MTLIEFMYCPAITGGNMVVSLCKFKGRNKQAILAADVLKLSLRLQ